MMETPQSDPDKFVDPLSDFEPAEYPSDLHRILAEESVTSMQTTPGIQVSSDATVAEATEKLRELKVSSLLVVNDEQLVGIFTERDVLEKAAENFAEIANHPVSEVMSSDPLVVYETDPVGAALAAIAVAGHRHVPVVRLDGTIAGIVSPKRILRRLSAHLD